MQYAPAAFRHLKSFVDPRRSESGLGVLTGSQLFPPMAGVSESLAGRAQVIHLEGLSYGEAVSARPALTPVEFVARGGHPNYTRNRNSMVRHFIVLMWQRTWSGTQMAVICRGANPYPLEGGGQALPLTEVRRLVA